MTIDSLLHPEAVRIRQVLSRAGRIETGEILIDDEENLIQALEGKIAVSAVFFSGPQEISKDLKKQLPDGVSVQEVAWRTCKKLFGTEKISRLFAIARMPEPTGLDLLAREGRDVVALEDVSISGNIGNILRTAAAFDIGAMVLLNMEHVDVFDRRLIRASRGFVFRLPVITAPTDQFVRACKEHGRKIVVAAAEAATTLEEIQALPESLAIVLGSEKGGASEAVKAAAAHQVRIPIHPRVESLNVSAAAAIFLYSRGRHKTARL